MIRLPLNPEQESRGFQAQCVNDESVAGRHVVTAGDHPSWAGRAVGVWRVVWRSRWAPQPSWPDATPSSDWASTPAVPPSAFSITLRTSCPRRAGIQRHRLGVRPDTAQPRTVPQRASSGVWPSYNEVLNSTTVRGA